MEPKPQHDVVITAKVYGGSRYEMRIYVANDSAYFWIEEEAGKFGRLENVSDRRFELSVNRVYRWMDVAEYLSTMGEGYPKKPRRPSMLERLKLWASRPARASEGSEEGA